MVGLDAVCWFPYKEMLNRITRLSGVWIVPYGTIRYWPLKLKPIGWKKVARCNRQDHWYHDAIMWRPTPTALENIDFSRWRTSGVTACAKVGIGCPINPFIISFPHCRNSLIWMCGMLSVMLTVSNSGGPVMGSALHAERNNGIPELPRLACVIIQTELLHQTTFFVNHFP